MIKHVFITILLISAFGCAKTDGSPLELLSLEVNSQHSTESILVGPAQIKECHIVTHKGFIFSMCLENLNNSNQLQKKSYIFTNDSSYITADKIKIGTTYGEIKKLFPDVGIITVEGWSNQVELPSKWIACFDYKTQVKDTSKVNFFYFKNK